MKVYNLRLGHACNSSSTHSIVPLAKVSNGRDSVGVYDNEFGWERFTLTSSEAKMRWLAAWLSGYGRAMPDEQVQALTGVEPDGTAEGEWQGNFGYVDHQSVPEIKRDEKYFDEFAQDLAEYLRREDVAILGGNDNDDGDDYWHAGRRTDGIGAQRLRPGLTPDGRKYWTGMARWSGDRVRFSFEDGPAYADSAYQLDCPYGEKPELVDLKVTDYCPFDCPWCYQASTLEGRHASWETALGWLDAFTEAGVFEIAMGGGEPSLWPHLEQFVQAAAEREINVNLTTKNLAWVAKGDGLKGLSAIAISINNRADLERLQKINLKDLQDDSWPSRPEVTVQCVPAFCDDELLADIVAYCHEHHKRVTFLGVKRVGRAAEEQRSDDLRWLEAVKPHLTDYWRYRGVAVDTVMAGASEDVFKDLNIDPVWYETEEGKFSCYVDAVESTVAVSSYAPAEQTVKSSPQQFVASFQASQRAAGVRA